MTKCLIIVPAIIILLSSCSGNSKQNKNDSSKDTTTAIAKNKTTGKPASGDYYKITGDSILILPFEIEVSLNAKAKERIMTGKETIIVNVSFTGVPKDSSKAKLEEDGSFYVAGAEKEITYGQVARFDNIKFSKKIYDQLADKDIDIGVNVYSGRKSSPDNLLNCEPLFDKISNVANKGFTLKGKLISGDD